MATVLVTGGSGTLGSHVVAILRERGHDVRVLSRRPGVGTHHGDLSSGEGVAEARRGASWVVHAASDTHRFGSADVVQTQHLLDACGNDVEHLVYVSIVGIDAIPFRYYRNKLRCEEIVSASSTPSTVLRATQFHELLAMGLGAVSRLPVAPLPAGFRFQPVAAREVAGAVAAVMEQRPATRAPDFGGPEVLELAELARQWQDRHQRPRRYLPVPLPGRVARGFREGRNTCPQHHQGVQTWRQFLAESPR